VLSVRALTLLEQSCLCFLKNLFAIREDEFCRTRLHRTLDLQMGPLESSQSC
jgi:hypothetical protein